MALTTATITCCLRPRHAAKAVPRALPRMGGGAGTAPQAQGHLVVHQLGGLLRPGPRHRPGAGRPRPAPRRRDRRAVGEPARVAVCRHGRPVHGIPEHRHLPDLVARAGAVHRQRRRRAGAVRREPGAVRQGRWRSAQPARRCGASSSPTSRACAAWTTRWPRSSPSCSPTARRWRATAPRDFEQAIDARRRDDIAFLVYTSGTTGAPKGAMMANRNLVFQIASVHQYLDCSARRPVAVVPAAVPYRRAHVHGVQPAGPGADRAFPGERRHGVQRRARGGAAGAVRRRRGSGRSCIRRSTCSCGRDSRRRAGPIYARLLAEGAALAQARLDGPAGDRLARPPLSTGCSAGVVATCAVSSACRTSRPR